MNPILRFSAVVSTTLWLIIGLSATLLCEAQTQQAASITFTSEHERVRVAPQGEVAELHLVVTNSDGQVVFDSGTVAAQPLEWNMTDAQGARVADGVYLCAISYRDSLGKLRKRVEQVTVTSESQSNTESEAATSAPTPTPTPITGSGTTGQLTKFTSASTIGNSVVTESGGKIGIATTAPSATLHIFGSQSGASTGNGRATPALLQTAGGKGGNTTGTTGQVAGPGASISLLAGNGGDAPAGSTNGVGGSITLQPGGPGGGAGSAGATGNVLIAPAGGNVGVGTSTPTAKLTVAGTIQTTSGGIKFPDNSVQTTAAISQTSGDSRYAQLGASNTFSQSQTITGNLTVTGTLNATLPSGSTNYIQNSTAQQASSNFNISGNGTAGGTLSANAVNAATQYNLNGSRILSEDASNNLFAGVTAGSSITTGNNNAFFGASAGLNNTSGYSNSFFGQAAGYLNTKGSGNTFIGDGAGFFTSTGNNNTFIGQNALGSADITNATAIGANSQVTQSNSLVLGSLVDQNNNPTDINVGIGTTAPGVKLHVVENSTFRVARMESSSNTGTWLELNNTSTGGHTWAILSSGSGNGEGAGNLVMVDQTGGGQVVIDDNLKVPSCTGCTVAPSDRNLKANFAIVDGRTILNRLSGIAIQTWNYKSEGAGVRHIGPMAQDFHAAFAVGTDDKHINTVDEGGVALAAIQELYRENLAKEKQIEELKSSNADLKASNAALEKRLAALESAVEKLSKR